MGDIKIGSRWRDTYYDSDPSGPSHRVIEVLAVEVDGRLLCQTVMDRLGIPDPKSRKTRLKAATLASGYEPVE